MSFLNGTDPGLRQTRTPTVDLFTAGVDFTAGSSTQVTLTNDPGTENNVIITFDGIVQHRNTYTVSGAVVTFDAAIGSGVSNVEATYTTTIPAATPADNSVTLAKLSDGTQGGLIYYGGSGAPTELAAGTSGQFLQTQGAGSNPVWAAAGGGAWTFIETQTASSSAQIDFVTGIDSTYAVYKLVISKLEAATDTANPSLRFSTNGGSTFDSGTNYEYHVMKPNEASASYSGAESGAAGQSNIKLANTAGTDSGENFSTELTIYDPSDATHYTLVTGVGVNMDSGNNTAHALVAGSYKLVTAVDGIRIYMDSGTIASGRFTLYGLKHS